MPHADRPALAIILGSTREGRFGPVVARWFVRRAEEHGAFELDVIDLAEAALPAVQQSHPVPSGEYTSAEARAFATRIAKADAFVLVTPEYNHGYPSAIKLALDSVHPEWRGKAASFVSYGGLAGGLRAVEQLRLVLAELHVATIRETVSFHMAHGRFSGDGELTEGEDAARAAKVMLDQLLWWSLALSDARRARPYA